MKLTQAILTKKMEFESGFTLPAGAAVWVSDHSTQEGSVTATFYDAPRHGWSSRVFVLGPDDYSILVRAKTNETTFTEVER